MSESQLLVELLFQAKVKVLQEVKDSRLSQRTVREGSLLFGGSGCGCGSAVVFFICFFVV